MVAQGVRILRATLPSGLPSPPGLWNRRGFQDGSLGDLSASLRCASLPNESF